MTFVKFVARSIASTIARASLRHTRARPRLIRDARTHRTMFITALCPTAHTAALGRAFATTMKTTKSSSSSMAIRGARVRAHASSDVKKSEAIVEATSIYPVVADVDTSFARCGFTSACEEAMNRQINIECA